MGNLQSISEMNEEEIKNMIENNPMSGIMTQEQKDAFINGVQTDEFKNLSRMFKEIDEKFTKKFDDILETNRMNIPPVSTYEGSCGFQVRDTNLESQRILDKYLPRELNNHARDILTIFNTTTFKQLRESDDKYSEQAFWSTPLNYLFLSHDQDFKEFLKPCTPEIMESLINNSPHDKTMTREILTYLFN